MKSLQMSVQHLLLRCVVLMSFIAPGNQAFALESIFGNTPEPMSAEEAFKAELLNVSAHDVELQFTIADGYYLYKKRLSFETTDSTATLGTPDYPEPLVHEDEFFGKSDVYRDSAVIRLPIENTNGEKSFNLNVGFQGCADMGLCYPPTTTSLVVDLPAQQSTTASSANKLDLNDLLKNKSLFNNDEESQTLLTPAEAFVPSIITADSNQIEVEWLIQPGYYLYRDKMHTELSSAGNASIKNLDIDRGEMQYDEFFGDVEILREVRRMRIQLDNATAIKNADIELFYQGCADIGVCFPPESMTLPVAFIASTDTAAVASSNSNDPATGSNVAALATGTAGATASSTLQSNVTANAATVTSQQQKVLPVSEQDKLSRLLQGGNLGLIALAFYGAGLLLAFTACVYPMIPILSSLIVGYGEKLSTRKAFSLSLVYVMSMASVFAVLGILVGLSGYNIQPLFQNPWVLTAFALLFVALALSMFGLYELQMPSALQSKVTEISNNQSGGTYTGVAVMGVLSALIVGPCVTPPLVAALAYIAQTGDATIGGIALFAIGIGMGTPLLLIGTSLGKFMPKAGGWMDTTQRIFGVILLAVAIYLLSRFLPGNVIMMMFAALAIFAGVFFGATDRLDSESRGSQRFGKSVGLIAVIYGAVLMVGALAGNTSMLSPLGGFVGNQSAGNSQQNANNEHVTFQRVKSLGDLDNVLAEAKAQNRPVMFDFYADWCVSCKEMEAFTFPDKRVREQLTDAILIQADVTKNDDDDKALLKAFGLFGPPAIILYDRDGTELTAGRVVGYMPAEKFSAHLQAYLN